MVFLVLIKTGVTRVSAVTIFVGLLFTALVEYLISELGKSKFYVSGSILYRITALAVMAVCLGLVWYLYSNELKIKNYKTLTPLTLYKYQLTAGALFGLVIWIILITQLRLTPY